MKKDVIKNQGKEKQNSLEKRLFELFLAIAPIEELEKVFKLVDNKCEEENSNDNIPHPSKN